MMVIVLIHRRHNWVVLVTAFLFWQIENKSLTMGIQVRYNLNYLYLVSWCTCFYINRDLLPMSERQQRSTSIVYIVCRVKITQKEDSHVSSWDFVRWLMALGGTIVRPSDIISSKLCILYIDLLICFVYNLR